MHLSPVFPTCSISCHGGLPLHPRRIRGSVYDGGRLPYLFGSIALADRVSLPPVHCNGRMGNEASLHDVQPVRTPSLRHGRDDLSSEPPSPADLVPRHVVAHQPKARGQRPWTAGAARARELSDGLGLPSEAPTRHGSDRSGLARRPGRGGRDVRRGSPGRRGPQTLGKQGHGGDRRAGQWGGDRAHPSSPDSGRIRPKPHWLREERGRAWIHRDLDGWEGYEGLKRQGYAHKPRVIRGSGKTVSALLPRVHRVATLLKRWMLGTHQGAVSRDQLDFYLDEFTYRFNRRTSRHRGKLFYWLVEQAVFLQPTPYSKLIIHSDPNG